MAEEIEELLKQTLADYRLSRSERQALKQVLAESVKTEEGRRTVRRLAFEIARRELPDARFGDILAWLDDMLDLLIAPVERTSSVAEAIFSPGDACTQRILGALRSARSGADICVFTITDDRISSAIFDAHKRGLALRIITDDEKAGDLGSDIDKLRDAGIAVRTDRNPNHMHHKFALFDQRVLLTGSFNWTRSAGQFNQENLIVSDDVRLVKAFARTFEDLWEEFRG